jgi:hypothetical protein
MWRLGSGATRLGRRPEDGHWNSCWDDDHATNPPQLWQPAPGGWPTSGRAAQTIDQQPTDRGRRLQLLRRSRSRDRVSYSFNVNASGSGRIIKTRACGEFRAYGAVGAVGAGGVGIVFSDTPCNTVNGTGQQLSRGRSFTALTAYTTITVYTDFHTSSGSFRIQS